MLGCAGGKTPGSHLPSFLINEELLLEGGSAASRLTLAEQARLTGVVVSHAHLDHIAELPYLADNIFGRREDSLKIIAARGVQELIQQSIFNDAVWPDFFRICHEDTPVLDFSAIEENETRSCNGIRITPYAVNHKGGTFGFILEDAEGALLYTGDTGPTETIWGGAAEVDDLRAIITEVSFPNRMEELARISKHMTPAMLYAEMKKMPPDIPVYIFHIKAQYGDETRAEIEAIRDPRIEVLEEGKTYRL